MRDFNGFRSHLGISTNVLSDRLARLTALGIVRPATDRERHGRHACELTEQGIDLLHLILLAVGRRMAARAGALTGEVLAPTSSRLAIGDSTPAGE